MYDMKEEILINYKPSDLVLHRNVCKFVCDLLVEMVPD